MARKKKGKGRQGKKTSRPTQQTASPIEADYPSDQGAGTNSALRFMIGDSVRFRIPNKGWHTGEVRETSFRAAKWPNSRPTVPYLIQEMSPDPIGPLFEVQKDNDSYIRVLPNTKYPQSIVVARRVAPPEPKDPLAYLYLSDAVSDSIPHPVFESYDAMRKWSNGRPITELQKYDDTCSTLCIEGHAEQKLFTVMPNKTDKVYGMDLTFALKYVAPRIRLRQERPLSFNPPMMSTHQLIESIIPQQMTIEKLESDIKTASSSKTKCHLQLQLGDMLNFGIKGCDRNRDRAMSLYLAAILDVDDENEAFSQPANSNPAGIAEACSAAAVHCHFQAEMLAFAHVHGKSMYEIPLGGIDRAYMDVPSIFECAPANCHIQNNLSAAMMMLQFALMSGFVSELALQYGLVLDEDGARSHDWMKNSKRSIEKIHDAFRNRQNILHIQKDKQSSGSRLIGVTESTLSKFQPKLMNIFRQIPSAELYSSGSPKLVTRLHIQLMELENRSRSICIFLSSFAREGGKIIDTMILPYHLQLFPFSDESLEWIWCRVAYLIHLGLQIDPDKESSMLTQRVRPMQICLRDDPWHRKLASFMQIKSLPLVGTSVALEDIPSEHRASFELDIARRARRLQESQNGDSVFTTLQYNIFGRSMYFEKALGETTFATSSSHIDKATRIQSYGDNHFKRCGYIESRRCYTDAIYTLVCHEPYIDCPGKDVFQLIGSILSSYAATCLELAKTQEASDGLWSLCDAIFACDLVLASKSIQSSIPDQVLRAIRFRRSLAESRRPNNFELIIDIMNGEDVFGARFVHVDLDANMELFTNKESETRDSILWLGSQMPTQFANGFCPVCLECFSSEILAREAVVQQGCNHMVCLSCLYKTMTVKSEIGVHGAYSCCFCRKKYHEDILGKAALSFLHCRPELNTAMHKLDDNLSKEDLQQIVQSLLKTNDCRFDVVEQALYDMQFRKACGVIWLAEGELSPEQKQEIFEEAKRPIDALKKMLGVVQTKWTEIEDHNDPVSLELSAEIKQLQVELCQAQQNAAADIYFRMNSSGYMGLARPDNEYTLDFHGLRVQDAKAKIDEVIAAILPVLKRINVITGRGRHNADGISALKIALRKHVAQKYSAKVNWHESRTNGGLVTLEWADSGRNDISIL